MDLIARSTKQLGAIVRRNRKKQGLTQSALAARMQSRQATISNLESGETATQIATLIDVLAALDLELLVRPRSKISFEKFLEDSF